MKQAYFMFLLLFISGQNICEVPAVTIYERTQAEYNGNNKNFSAVIIKISSSIEKTTKSFLALQEIKNALQWGNQIIFDESMYEKTDKEESALFKIKFSGDDKTISWRLYSISENKMIEGKEYSVSKKIPPLVHAISKDIWTALFGEGNHFEYDLVYVSKNSNNEKKMWEIHRCCPCVKGNNKTIVRSSKAILDMSSINPATINSFIVYSQATLSNVKILKLSSTGSLSVVVNQAGTSGNFVATTSLEDNFYVRSGILYHCYYDENRNFIHKPFTTINMVISPAIGPDKSIFYSSKNKIWQIEITKNNTTEPVLISEKERFALSPSYCNATETLLYTQKEKGFMQLVSYDIKTKKKKVITDTKYHKQDPSLSPCGTYVAYIAFDQTNNKNYLECMNMHTNTVIRIEEAGENCMFPCWLKR